MYRIIFVFKNDKIVIFAILLLSVRDFILFLNLFEYEIICIIILFFFFKFFNDKKGREKEVMMGGSKVV